MLILSGRQFLLPLRGVLSVAIAALLASLAACSQQQIYSAVQQNRKHECEKLPAVQYEECMNAHSQTYDAFKQDRDAMLED